MACHRRLAARRSPDRPASTPSLGVGCGSKPVQRLALVRIVMQHERLAAAFGSEALAAGVRHLNLDRAEAHRAQGSAMALRTFSQERRHRATSFSTCNNKSSVEAAVNRKLGPERAPGVGAGGARAGASPAAAPQHSTMLTARPPCEVSLYLSIMSRPVWRMVSITLSSGT